MSSTRSELDSGRRQVPASRQGPGQCEAGTDWVVVEEPLELRIAGTACATVMRTPGHDRHLALGFLFTDGWIERPAQVGSLALCGRGASEREQNIADLIPAAGAEVRRPDGPQRHGAAVSSCGVCGKRTIEDVLALIPPGDPGPGAGDGSCPARFRRQVICRLPDRLRAAQRIFASTGSLHAAGLFDGTGQLLAAAEDVGRHNAVDKVIGWAFESEALPLAGRMLFVSGRVSFEIVQKAFRGGLSFVGAVSGVSSLAIDLADQAGITLVGFVRGESFSAYTHLERLAD